MAGGANGVQGCLGQKNPSSEKSDSWTIPSALAPGRYRIKVAVWSSPEHAAGAFSLPFTVTTSMQVEYINVSDWAQDAADYMVNNGFVEYPANHDLRGTEDANRAELATMIYRVLGSGEDAADSNFERWHGSIPSSPFDDVQDPSVWYYKPVVYLASLSFEDDSNKITVFDRGTGESLNPLFRAGNGISRAWTLKAILEAWNIRPLTSFGSVALFNDVPISHEAAGYIYKAKQLGIVSGTDGNFRPNESADRQDIFLMLHRMLDVEENSLKPAKPSIDAQDFLDLGVNHCIGSMYEQPVLFGVQTPSASIHAASLVMESGGVHEGLCTGTLNASVSDLDSGTYTDSRGDTHTAEPFFAWCATGGSFVDITRSGIPFSQVKWIAPVGKGASEFLITLYVGDGLGSLITKTHTYTTCDAADPGAEPVVTIHTLPSSKTGGQSMTISGTVKDSGDADSDTNYGIQNLSLFYSTDNKANWNPISNNAAFEADGTWRDTWIIPQDFSGTLWIKAEARNIRGSVTEKEASVTINMNYRVEGTVLDAYGSALENAWVSLGGETEYTDNQGFFKFEGLSARIYTVTASLAGHEFESAEVTLNADEPVKHVDIVEKAETPNEPPVASINADQTEGQAPLSVNFSSDGSNDPEGRSLTYSWNFGDGNTKTGSGPHAHTYTECGKTFTAVLEVTDDQGLANDDVITISVICDPEADSDSDGMKDLWETEHFGNLDHDGSGDTDSDGLADLQEYQNNTDPRESDTDYDGMPDGWETQYSLDPLGDDSTGDPDGDGVSNLDEYKAETDPTQPDGDGDGINDSEDLFPNDPAEWQDSDNDGIGDNADPDDDNDGLSDDYETAHGLDPLNPDDALLDNDNDGYTNLEESQCGGSDPNDPASIPACDITQEIILTEGWNLISLFVEPADASPAAIFGPIADSLAQVKSASASHDPNLPDYLNDLNEIQSGYGYWVKVDAVSLLQITGPPVDVAALTIPLYVGWNLVGYPLMEEMPVEDALSGIMESLNQAKSMSESFDPNLPAYLNDLSILEPNMGYWINVSEDAILQYPAAP